MNKRNQKNKGKRSTGEDKADKEEMSGRLKPPRRKPSPCRSSHLRKMQHHSSTNKESSDRKNRGHAEIVLDDTEDNNGSKELVKDFFDLTKTPDPIRSNPSLLSVLNSVKGLKDTLRLELYKPILQRSLDKLLEPLNPDEEQVYQILTVKAPATSRLASFRKLRSRVYVTYLDASHFRVLQPQKWDSDEIVNAYGMLINKRTDDTVEGVRNMRH